MYIPNNFYISGGEFYNNGLLRRYKPVQGISFKLNAEEIKQFRKFLNRFKF